MTSKNGLSSRVSRTCTARACSLLVLPRLDDREGQQMLRTYQASEVVELGESIGVETRLYSEQAQQTRIRALALVRCSQPMASVRLDPLVPCDRPVEPLRLRCVTVGHLGLRCGTAVNTTPRSWRIHEIHS